MTPREPFWRAVRKLIVTSSPLNRRQLHFWKYFCTFFRALPSTSGLGEMYQSPSFYLQKIVELRRVASSLSFHILHAWTMHRSKTITIPFIFQRKRANILLEPSGNYFNDYDPQVNPEIINAFATAAFRMGHSMIRDEFGQFDRQFRQQGFISMKTFFDPSPLYSLSKNGISGIFLGLVAQASLKVDR